MSTMYSKAKIAGHPIHPMLIAFPVTFYTTAFVAFVVYAITHQVTWWQIGLRANVAGLVTAAVAALPGAIDLFTAIPNGSAAKATGLKHALSNGVASTLFLINLLVHRAAWGDLRVGAAASYVPDPTAALALTGLGLLALLVAGFLGWKLVQTHHVGVDLNAQQRELESRTAH